jgi:hypothetical protein
LDEVVAAGYGNWGQSRNIQSTNAGTANITALTPT